MFLDCYMCIFFSWNPQQSKQSENIRSFSHNKTPKIGLQDMCMYDGHLRVCIGVYWCCRHGGSRPGRGACGQFIDCCEWTTLEGSSCNHSECCHAPDGFPGHRREEHGSGKGRGHQEPAPAGGFSPRWIVSPASHPNVQGNHAGT
jgi:hypothetical protein